MKIGFDLDKVLIDYPPFIPDWLIDRLYKEKANGLLRYRMPSKPEQVIRQLSHLPYLRPPMKKNIEFLKTIPQNQHELYLISSRFKFLENRTRDLVKKYRFDDLFTEMYFNYENKQPHLFKNEMLKNLQLDMYIDDDLPLLSYVSKDNRATKLFWLTNERNHKSVTPPIFAIDRLSCILEKDYA